MCSIMGYLGTTITKEEFKEHFDETISRGPDMQRIVEFDGGILGFERLSIMGLSEAGMQPFSLNNNLLVCNGEVYCFRPIKEELSKKYTFSSESDCEILLPLYEEKGLLYPCKIDEETGYGVCLESFDLCCDCKNMIYCPLIQALRQELVIPHYASIAVIECDLYKRGKRKNCMSSCLP